MRETLNQFVPNATVACACCAFAENLFSGTRPAVQLPIGYRVEIVRTIPNYRDPRIKTYVIRCQHPLHPQHGVWTLRLGDNYYPATGWLTLDN
jgi:hypothetical protein